MPNVGFGEIIRSFLPGFVLLTSGIWLAHLFGDLVPPTSDLLHLFARNPVLGAFVYSTLSLLIGLVLNSILFAFMFDPLVRDWSVRVNRRRVRRLTWALGQKRMLKARRDLLRSRLDAPSSARLKRASDTVRSREQFEALQDEVLRRATANAFVSIGARRGDYLPDFYATQPPNRDVTAAADERYFYYTQFQFYVAFAWLALVMPLSVWVVKAVGFEDWHWLLAALAPVFVVFLAAACLTASRRNYLNYLRARNSWLTAALAKESAYSSAWTVEA